MSKTKVIISVCFILTFYLSVSLWRFSFTPFESHPDGYFYHKVARNLSLGKGLVADTILQFYPRAENVTHPIGLWWNPLSIYILSGFYKVFGISDFTARIGALLFDGIICLFIFLFCLNVYKDYWIAVFSALIFATHIFTIVTRTLGGAAETFHLFFVTFFCYLVYKGMEKNYFFLLAGLGGALAYLVRNESIWTIFVLILIFLYTKYYLRKEKNTLGWIYLIGAIFIFVLTILPWEIRNFLLYGKEANWAKYNLIFSKEYYDIWSYSKNPSLSEYIREYLSLGLKRIIEIKIQSYYYKLDTAIGMLTWPLVFFLSIGLAFNLKKKEFLPVYLYFVVTYVMMGFINSVSQYGGWHAPGTLLAFFIPICVSGCFHFGSMLTQKKNIVKLLGITLASFIFLYHFIDNYKSLKKIQRGRVYLTSQYAQIIGEYFKRQHKEQESIVIMTHTPQYINFYTDLKTVQIPTNEPLEIVREVIKKYKCNYLVLYGYIPSVFAKLYSGEEKILGFTLVYEKVSPGIPFEGAGDRIKIYQVNSAFWK